MSKYRAALKAANRVGAARATDAGAAALYCDTVLQLIVGAASPELVWNGVQKAGMTTAQLAKLAIENPSAVHDLMWD